MTFQKLLLVVFAVLIAGCASQQSIWKKTVNNNTIKSYENYLSKYPEGDYSSQAKSSIEKLSFESAKNINTIESYNEYLLKYPIGEYVSQANSNIEKLTFDEAINKNTTESYNKYLLKYPDGKYSSKGKSQIEKLTFDNASSQNTIDSFNEYISKYPEGEYTSQAKSYIEKLVFEEAKNKDTYEGYQKYLSKYPNGKFIVDVNSQLAKFEYESSLQDYETYFKNHSKSQSKMKINEIRNGILTKLNQTADNNIQLAKEKEDLLEKAQCYVDGAEAFIKAAQIDKIIGEDETKSYEKSAYLYYLASRMCQLQEMKASVAKINAWINNPRSSSVQSLQRETAAAQLGPHLQKSLLYVKSAELYKKAGQEDWAKQMMEGGTILVFSVEELEKELKLK